jgi:hypothetical protein
MPLDGSTAVRQAPQRARPLAPREPKPYRLVIRDAFGVGLVVGIASWSIDLANVRALVPTGGLINDFIFVVPVVVAGIAIEAEHCRRWGYTRSSTRFAGAMLVGLFWIALALGGYLVGQQPAFIALENLTSAGQPPAYAVRVTVAAIAVGSSLAGVVLVWLLRIRISERRRMYGPQIFAEAAEIFEAVLSVLNRIVHLFTGLVCVAGGILVLMGLQLGSGYLSELASAYVPPWMQTVGVITGVVAACFFLAKGFQRLLRAASLKPGAMTGPHGSAYTATASDLRRAGILQ